MMRARAVRRPMPADAAGWWACVRSGEMAPDERERLETWLGESDDNRRAFGQLAAISAELEALRSDPEILAMREDARRAGGNARHWLQAIAATLVLLCLVGSSIVYLGRTVQPAAEMASAVYKTERGQIGRVRLADGTVAVLDADSYVRATMTGTERRVDLLRGRAYVEVAHDTGRPFVFHAGGKTVTALGTRFDVRLLEAGIEVVLEEGRVRVAGPPVPGRPPTSVDMSPGYRLRTGAQGWSLAATDTTQETSWRSGTLVFDEARIADVVSEMNRYLEKPIVIADPVLADRRLSAVLRAGDVATFFALLETLGLAEGRPRDGGGYELITI